MTTDRFPVTELTTARLRLRPFTESDVDDVVASCRHPAARFFLSFLPDPYEVDDAHEFIASSRQKWDNGFAGWAIADRETDRYQGSIGVPRMDWPNRVAEIGYLVAPWAQGRGVAAEATIAVTDFLFDNDMERVELLIRSDNIASQRTALRAGFSRDGEHRSGLSLRDGSRLPKVVYSRLPTDLPPPTERSLPDLPAGGLTDGVVSLRPLADDDFESCLAHQELPEVWGSSMPPVPPSPEAVRDLCRFGAADQWLAGHAARMTVRDARSDAFAGEIGLYWRGRISGEAMIGYSLAREFRGRGFMTRAVRLVAAWAFAEVGVKRLIAGTAVTNADSQHVLKRAGFTREGIERQLLLGPDDTRVDNVKWSMLAGEL